MNTFISQKGLPRGRRPTLRGQSMFELLLAVFVIAISLTAVVSLVTNSISNSTFSKDRTLASKYTQEAVEWLREQRDLDWGEFIAHGNASGINYCMYDLDDWHPGPCSSPQYITGTNLMRQITLIYPASNPDTVEARIATWWQDQSGRHESRVTTYFSNWRTR